MQKQFLDGGNPFTVKIEERYPSKVHLESGVVQVDCFEITGPDTFRIGHHGETFEGQYLYADSRLYLHLNGQNHRFEEVRAQMATVNFSGEYKSPMPGKVIALQVALGDKVEAEQTLVVVEAMKMENSIKAESSGQVTVINCKPGDLVAQDDVLVQVRPVDPTQ